MTVTGCGRSTPTSTCRCSAPASTARPGILKGDFNYAGVEVGFPSPGLGPLGPIFVQRIKFRIEVSPKKSECVPHLGVEDVGIPPIVQKVDFGVPTFALCGEVGLTAGPQILGAAAISLDAGLGLATYDDRPSVMRAFGDLKVIGIPFAKATFEAHSDGFVKVQGKFSYGWDGFASVSGHISLGMLGSKFNAEGGVEACLEFVDFCRGVNALISSKGMAVCMVIDYEIDDWRPGLRVSRGVTRCRTRTSPAARSARTARRSSGRRRPPPRTSGRSCCPPGCPAP